MTLRTSVQIRAARPSDEPAVRELTRNIWEGNDYVPRVWERWLREPGALMVAVMDGRLVGLQHVALHPDGSAWFEGIRVAEDVRGTGVGRALLEHGLAWTQAMGLTTARLSVSTGNRASNKLAERGGFRVVGEFRPVRAEPLERPVEVGAVHIALPSDTKRIEDFFSRAVGGMPSVYTEGWTAYRLDKQRLQLLLATHGVLTVGDHRIDGLAIATSPAHRPAIRLGLLAGSAEAVRRLGLWLRSRSAEVVLPLRGTINSDEMRLAALAEVGYDLSEEYRMLLRERTFTAQAS